MSYQAPTLAPSGITFAQWQAAGAAGHLEKLIAAQTAPPVPTVAATISLTGGGQTVAVPTVAATANATTGGQTVAVPTVAATVSVGSASTGSLPAGTYYVGYTWYHAHGETTAGAGSPAASVSTVFTVSAGNIPTVTLPNLPTGALGANIYLSNTNGVNTALVLYRHGITQATGATCSLDSGLWNGGTFAAGTVPPASNTTPGALAAGTYYVGYTWTHAHGETTAGAGSPAASVSSVLTVSAGNIPRVTIPSLPTGATAANIYLSNTNGTNTALVLYATGVTTTTADLTASTWNGGTFASGIAPPASNGTAGSLAAGTYYLNFTETDGVEETVVSAESATFTPSAGNIPRVTFPALQTGNIGRNLYVTAAGGVAGTETLYATGISTLTYDLVAANPAAGAGGSLALATPATAAAVALSSVKLSLLRSAKQGNLEDVFRLLRQVVYDFNRGDPTNPLKSQMKLRDAHTVFLALATVCNEAGVLMDADPGSISLTTNPIGNSKQYRTWP